MFYFTESSYQHNLLYKLDDGRENTFLVNPTPPMYCKFTFTLIENAMQQSDFGLDKCQ